MMQSSYATSSAPFRQHINQSDASIATRSTIAYIVFGHSSCQGVVPLPGCGCWANRHSTFTSGPILGNTAHRPNPTPSDPRGLHATQYELNFIHVGNVTFWQRSLLHVPKHHIVNDDALSATWFACTEHARREFFTIADTSVREEILRSGILLFCQESQCVSYATLPVEILRGPRVLYTVWRETWNRPSRTNQEGGPIGKMPKRILSASPRKRNRMGARQELDSLLRISFVSQPPALKLYLYFAFLWLRTWEVFIKPLIMSYVSREKMEQITSTCSASLYCSKQNRDVSPCLCQPILFPPTAARMA
jgi:hypothetical protein